MNIYEFIGCYFIIALTFGVIISVILILTLMNDSEGYSKRENVLFVILTSLTAIAWPILIIYLFYLNYKDKERVAKNKRFYKKCNRYFMNAQIENTFVSNVLNFINHLYYAPDNMDYDGVNVFLTWYASGKAHMEIICNESGVAHIEIFPYYNIPKDQNDTINDMTNQSKIQNTGYYTELDGIKQINLMVEDFLDKAYV